VPEKNFRPLAGKPLVRWILDELLSLTELAQIVINTDARAELAGVGVVDAERIRIRNRKAELCGDRVSMNRILEDDIAAAPSDLYLMTHTTNPLLTAATMRAAMTKLSASPSADSLFSVNHVQARFYRADGSAVNHDPATLARTQDLEPWYEENSCLYLFTASSFAATRARIGRHPVLFETPPLESVDIDEMHHWTIAEALLTQRERTRP
jgi:CMP-N-acetylneuraminic acid synthetase